MSKLRKYLTGILSVGCVLVGAAARPSFAETERPLNDGDRLFVALENLSSDENAQVRVRAALCVEFNKCEEFTITPVLPIRRGEKIDYAKKDPKVRRSQIFTGKELNDRLIALAKKKGVSRPRPQIAVMAVTVGSDIKKALKKSDSAYLKFPAQDERGEVVRRRNEKGEDREVGILTNSVKVRLDSIEVNLLVAIERQP